ncbi:MAG: hypothetical protein N2690_00780, partial [Rhodocyclaceae bacterium]|nr:hypothetical protein [Rhodocyclaceae bacterium]
VIVRALLPQLEKLRAEADAMPKTISAAASGMKDAFGRVVDEFNRATGATSAVANAMSSLAANMDAVLGGAAVAAAGALAAALARGGQAAAASVAQLMAKIAADRQAAISAQAVAAHEVAKAQAMLAAAQAAVAASSGMARLALAQTQLVPAQQQLAAAQAALNAAMASGGVLARGLSAALGLLGGPLGAILTLLTMGATAWAIWGDKAATAADKARASAQAAREALARLEREQKYGTGDAATFREEIARLEARKALLEESARVTYRGRPSDALKSELASVHADLQRYREALAAVEEKEKSTASAAYDTFGLKRRAIEQFVDGFRARIDPLKAALDELKKKFQDAKIPLDSREYREAEAVIRRSFARKQETAPRLPRLVESFDAGLAALRANLKTAEETLEVSFRARLVKEDAYWQAKGAMQKRALELEAADLVRQIADQERQIAALRAVKPKDDNQRQDIADQIARAQNKLSELRVKLAEVDGRKMVVDLEVQSNLDRVRQELDDLKLRLQGEIAEATGQMTPELRMEMIRAEFRDALARMAGDAEAEALIERVISVRAAKAQLADLEQAWRLALETMRAAEQSANIQREAGLITTADAQAKIAEAHRVASAEMDALLPKMEAIASTLGPEAVARIQAWKNELASVQNVVDPLAASLDTAIKSGFEEMFASIGRGAKSAKAAFLDFAQSVVTALQRIFAQRLAEQIFGALGKGSIGGSILSFFGLKFATGGPVPGSGNGDTVPALLTPGEYVIRKDAVRRYGRALLDAINGVTIPPAVVSGRLAFSAGGLVPQVGGTVNNVSVVVNAESGRAQADPSSAVELGRRIEAAVRGVLIAERRPGGLLAGA